MSKKREPGKTGTRNWEKLGNREKETSENAWGVFGNSSVPIIRHYLHIHTPITTIPITIRHNPAILVFVYVSLSRK